MRANQTGRIGCALAILLLAATSALAQTDTTFTYQGELKESGVPASGSYNIDVSLWDAASGGVQIGSTIMFNALPVSDGLFTVELDFGANAFDNTGRWLQIIVNGNELTPRQPITRAPYAIQTRGIFVDENNMVGIGTTDPVDHLHVRGTHPTLRLDDDIDPDSFTEIKDAGTGQLRINKTNSSGQVLLDLNPKPSNGTSDAQIRFFRETNTTGPKNVQFLRGNFSTQASARIGVDGQHSFFQAHGGSVSIGTGLINPSYSLYVTGDGSRTIVGRNTATTGLHMHGVHGQTESTGGASAGVNGLASATSGVNYGVKGQSDSPSGFGIWCGGNFGATGTKSFIQPHPDDASKEIHFVCLEGNESGTYFRGSSRLVNGRAVIEVPEEFRLVSENEGVTVQVTAMGPNAGLWVEAKGLDQVVVRGNGEVEFDYFVNGVRRGFADLKLIRENHAYVPELRGVPYGTQYRPGHRRILVENGILNADFTPNEQTAASMEWTLRDPEPEDQPTGESQPNSGGTK